MWIGPPWSQILSFKHVSILSPAFLLNLSQNCLGQPDISNMLIDSLVYCCLIGSVAAGILPNRVELNRRNATTTAGRWPGGGPYCVNSERSRQCWSAGFDINTDSEKKWPNTGKIVHYDLSITNQTMSPDGTPRDMLVINGQFPGPVLTAGKL
jgi:hypothetical protein